jgi:integrase
LESRAARAKLKRRPTLYYAQIERGLHLGYRPPLQASRAGTWELRSYIGEQKYRRETIGSADDTNDADGVTVLSFWQAVETARGRLQENAALSSAMVTVDAVMHSYLKYIEQERKDVANTKNRIEQHVLPTFGGRDAASLTKKEIEAWRNQLAKTPARARSQKGKAAFRPLASDEAKRRRKSSANRIFTVLRAALNKAYADDKLKDAPWRRVKPFRNVDGVRLRYLKNDEARRLINAADPDFRKLVQAALLTGCRYGELCRLQVSDLHPGVHSATILVRDSKSGHQRHVHLNDEGRDFFARLCAGRVGAEPMLLRNGCAWKTSEQSRPILEACKHAKIEPPINFHALRHTYCSLAIMNGVPLLVIARNVGHKDTKMVERHYGHLAASYEAAMIRERAPSFGIEPDPVIVRLDKAHG